MEKNMIAISAIMSHERQAEFCCLAIFRNYIKFARAFVREILIYYAAFCPVWGQIMCS